MGAWEDYVSKGGITGIARQQISNALQEAHDDPHHEFHSVASPLTRFAVLKAVRSLFGVLSKALIETSSKYHLAAVVFLQIPAARFAIDHAWDYLKQRGWQGPTDNEDLEDVWNLYLAARKNESALKISAGASAGGKITAAKVRAENRDRDRKIRDLGLPIDELAQRFGLTPRRVRQIVNFK